MFYFWLGCDAGLIVCCIKVHRVSKSPKSRRVAAARSLMGPDEQRSIVHMGLLLLYYHGEIHQIIICWGGERERERLAAEEFRFGMGTASIALNISLFGQLHELTMQAML